MSNALLFGCSTQTANYSPQYRTAFCIALPNVKVTPTHRFALLFFLCFTQTMRKQLLLLHDIALPNVKLAPMSFFGIVINSALWRDMTRKRTVCVHPIHVHGVSGVFSIVSGNIVYIPAYKRQLLGNTKLVTLLY